MSDTLAAFVSDGYLVITLPEASLSPLERDGFVSAVKSEWLARQSQMTEADAKQMADESMRAGGKKIARAFLKNFGET